MISVFIGFVNLYRNCSDHIIESNYLCPLNSKFIFEGRNEVHFVLVLLPSISAASQNTTVMIDKRPLTLSSPYKYM